MRSVKIAIFLGMILGVGIARAFADDYAARKLTKDELFVKKQMLWIKKSPQVKVARAALGILLDRKLVTSLQVSQALIFDADLMHPLASVRIQAAKELREFRHPTALVAIQNLQLLLRTETKPEDLWYYALALAEIDPEVGNAVIAIKQNPFDPRLRAGFIFSSPPLDGTEYTLVLVGKHFVPGEIPEPLTRRYEPLSPREKALIESFGPSGETNHEDRRWGRAEEAPPPLPTPSGFRGFPAPSPPSKIAVHPLIAEGRFSLIMALRDQHKAAAWRLFEDFAFSFPAEMVAKRYVPMAFDRDPKKRGSAMSALWDAGPDAVRAAPAIYALTHDFALAHQIEMIEGLTGDDPFSAEVLRTYLEDAKPKVQIATLAALIDHPHFEPLVIRKLKTMLADSSEQRRYTAVQLIEEPKELSSPMQDLLQSILVRETHPGVLGAAMYSLRKIPASKAVQQKVLEAIDTKRFSKTDLLRIQYLLNRNQKELATQNGKDRKLVESLERLEELSALVKLHQDAKAIIEGVQRSKTLGSQESLEQLIQMSDLLDD